MTKIKRSRPATPSLSQIVYGNLSQEYMRFGEEVVRKGRPFVVSGVRKLNTMEIGRAVVMPKSAPVPEPKKEPERFIEVEFDETPVEVNAQYGGVVAENEYVIDQDYVDETREIKDRMESPVREALREMTAMLYAVEDASNFVEASMRDGLGFDTERDSNMEDALVPITRVAILTKIIGSIEALSPEVKRLMINKLASRSVDEIIGALNKRKVPEALAAMRKQYAATLKDSGITPDDELPVLGLRSSRG